MHRYDRTVRDEVGAVVQFLYGEDGMDATLIESQTLDHLKMSPEQLARTYRYDLSGPKPAWMHPSAYGELQDAEVRAMVDAEYEVRICCCLIVVYIPTTVFLTNYHQQPCTCHVQLPLSLSLLCVLLQPINSV